MNLFDDNPPGPSGHEISANETPALPSPNPQPVAELPTAPLTGDPISYAAAFTTVASPSAQVLPEDLRISWSWPHLLIFIIFWFASQIAIGIIAALYYSVERHVAQSQMKQVLESDPRFIVSSTVLWSGLMLLFLYVTLSVLRGSPFWSSLGWKKLRPNSAAGIGRPWMYFICGCGLSLLVAIAGSRVKNSENLPIQELFKSRTGALLLMAMAVFVAPLVEETLFRGYLYPVLARIITAVAQFFGMKSPTAIRTGVASSVLVTGVLFGLLHAPQLGFTLGFVALLTLVGVIFTFVRAWTGTVLASFLLHLGYNSFIAVTSIITTRGFTHLPPVH
jgi:membrane protease YdiL (CAAX protease family)